MNPPAEFHSADSESVTLYITWAVGVVGPERFESCGLFNGRHLLRDGDELRDQGEAAGLKKVVLDWLIGGEDELTLAKEVFE
jgi:hypothetical protein